LFGFKKQEKGLLMSSNHSQVLKVSNISKCFQIYKNPADRLKQFLLPRLTHALGRPASRYYQEFWALKDISFVLPKGETIGVIGKNGSGKSTLLQIITGTLSQTTGTVEKNGRIAALLELGAGFNLEFSGRENIYLNASLLGLSKEETDAKLEDILSFADIGDFVHVPVKSYSSGMLVRLAFAIQAQIEPEILIVDEALAVGDAKFQAKCFARLNTLKENGTSILFVSHATEQILTHCDYAILLDKGQIKQQGQPKKVVNHYLDLLFGKPKLSNNIRGDIDKQISAASQGEQERLAREVTQEAQQAIEEKFLLAQSFETHVQYNSNEYRWGDRAASIVDFHIAQNGHDYPNSFTPLDEISCTFKIQINRSIVRPIFGFAVKTKDGITIYNTNTEKQKMQFTDALENEVRFISVKFPNMLAQGDYFISIGIASYGINGEIIPHDRRYDAIHLHVEPTVFFDGLTDLKARIHFGTT
jgi:lipopolysaccharide transport system ATP-binding protein